MHTKHLLDELHRLKQIYPDIPYLHWELLHAACTYHDVGKVTTKMQNKILKSLDSESFLNDPLPNKREVPHGYLSCAFVPLEILNSDGDKRIVLQAIFFHHHRLPVDPSELEECIQEDLIQYYEALQRHVSFSIQKPKFNFYRYASPGKRIRKSTAPDLIRPFIVVKGLLNKIDHAASGGLPVEIKNPGLHSFVIRYVNDALKGELNELQRYVIEQQDENLVIIASTGIGKTEAALLWLGDKKGFFTLPLRVSINSIFERVSKTMGFAEVALLHSETEREYISHDVFSIDYYERTKQWSMPLTICTMDQILDFVFKQEGYEKKLATLSYSKIVVDEIQMYSAKMLACLLYSLKEITDIGGKFMIMTATFAPFIKDFMRNLHIPFKQTDSPFLKRKKGKSIIRHRLQVKDWQLTAEEITTNTEDQKILVIVNTVARAQSLYHKLRKNRKDVYLFHSRFIKRDRKAKEKAIMEMGKLSSNKRGIWITTQVVEASVDIDFDVLYTELSDLNGLFQRMGRIYRNRILDHERVNIYVFTGGSTYPSGIHSSNDRSIIDRDIFDLSKAALMPFTTGVIFTEEMKMSLVEKEYTTEKLVDSDYYREVKDYLHLLDNVVEYEKLDPLILDLRGIFNETIIPFSVYAAHEEYITEILQQYQCSFDIDNKEEARMNRGRLRSELLDYTVDIPHFQFEKAKKTGLIKSHISLGSQLSLTVVDYPYDSEIGLSYK